MTSPVFVCWACVGGTWAWAVVDPTERETRWFGAGTWEQCLEQYHAADPKFPDGRTPVDVVSSPRNEQRLTSSFLISALDFPTLNRALAVFQPGNAPRVPASESPFAMVAVMAQVCREWTSLFYLAVKP